MTVDDLINNALKGRGGVLDVSGFYALVGDVQTQELFVLNLQDFFIDNLEHFRTGTDTGIILLGGYTSEQAARNVIKTAAQDKYLGDGLVVAPEWHILMGNVKENRLFALPLKEYYMGYLGFFLHKVNSGNVAISIFDRKDAAEDAIDLIRYEIRGDGGDSVK